MEKAASLKLTFSVAVLFCFVNATKSTGVPHSKKVDAIAVITGRDGHKGNIFFSQDGDHAPTILNGFLAGLSPGHHGFHVHATGDTRHGCDSTGGHFNPYNKLHGGKEDHENRHVGDLGNLFVNGHGHAHLMNFSDNKIRLTGTDSIIGRAIVIHKDQDDFGWGGHNDSKSTGHAGERIACGIIGLLS